MGWEEGWQSAAAAGAAEAAAEAVEAAARRRELVEWAGRELGGLVAGSNPTPRTLSLRLRLR